MPGNARSDRLVRFEDFVLDLRTGELAKNGDGTVRLSEQPLRVLVALLEHSGELVLREDLRKRLWPNDTVVEFEHGIGSAVNRLRQALGDSAENPHFIETLARRGYRWKTPVEWIEATAKDHNASAPAAGQNLVGKRVAHYRVLEVLGGGGMGLVYKAEDIKLGRRVALKFLPEELAADPIALERFRREARAASASDHPNICTIYEVGEYKGVPYIAMQLLQGQTLSERVTATPSGPMPLAELLALAIQVTDGLDAAHRGGIIHRDIKPANIFITTRGEAKILDFGLAKLADAGEQSEALAGQEILDGSPADLNLTRAGTALGTASYMSPEQVQGEKLDARTDLFSFGLVLYEMATGQRAFPGNSASEVRDAVLHLVVGSVRELNPGIPQRLEEIIAKALKKDREARYQSASDLRADLKTLADKVSSRWPARLRYLTLGSVAAISILWIVLWFSRPSPRDVPSTPDLKLRQLTTNSAENIVLSGAISPDGQYLAYSDTKGMHVKIMQTGEIRAIPQPASVSAKDVDWEIMAAWLPDGRTFVANSHPSGGDRGTWFAQGTSIWLASVLGGPPRKLRDEAQAYGISPDGSQIAFGANMRKVGEGEAWLMGVNGESARRVLDGPEDGPIDWLFWSPDQKRFIYVKFDAQGHPVLVSRDLNGGTVTTVVPAPEFGKINELSWLPDGRLLYELPEPGSLSVTCNYWVKRIDLRTGELLDQPRRLTNWTGICPSYSSYTAGGKRLAFRVESTRQSVYVANFDPSGKVILSSREFTPEIGGNPMDWTPDSKSVIFFASRNDESAIYKQSLDKDTPDLIVSAHGGFNGARISPDGKWIVWFIDSDSQTEKRFQLMRAPIQGGTPELLFDARPGSQILCAKSEAGVCAVVERSADGQKKTVTAFDPAKGRGAELFQYDVDPKMRWAACDLSPDGTRIAAVIGVDQPIQIFSLQGNLLQLVPTRELSDRQIMFWAADGKGLFVTNGIRGGLGLFHVDMQGHTTFLWKNNGGYYPWALQSPDGRHLAIQGSILNANMWMMENF